MSEFAFGVYTDGPCGCPAVEAGIDVDDIIESSVLGDVTERYDERAVDIVGVQNSVTTSHGRINELRAREAWFGTIRDMADEHGDDSERAERARKIARENGWEDHP